MLVDFNMIKFNPPISIQKEVVPVCDFTYTPSLKGVSLEYALEHSNAVVQNVISQIPLQYKHKYITVFVKPMQTTVGESTCLAGWHIDAVETPYKARTNRSELHHIWCGYSNDTTEFIETPLMLNLDAHDDLVTMREKIELQPYVVTKIPRHTIVSYERLNLHRGPICQESTNRLLIRVSETDTMFGGMRLHKENRL